MTSPYALQGWVAVVTGGSRGIGRAVAGALAAAGAQVCVTARDTRAVRRTADELGGAGLAGDVADPAHLQELTAFALRTFGRIDVLVNNAATNQPYGPLVEAEPGRWREAFTVNVEAPLRLVQCVWRAWMGEHGGTVVNICTEGAGHVGPNVGAYGTSKAALLHLTRQLAGELAPKVRVNSVSPGLVRTETARFVWESGEDAVAAGLPLGRIGEAEDIARAVLWPASEAAGWITGADLLVDGGTRVGPVYVPESSASGTYAIQHRLRSCAPHQI
ncbi:SDR family oxidoreductase [Streptomyces sp. NPDC093269]|uniref:SDR family oxidoreductase n=1 Tax=Streptomyces sp. NPDC093269 TaxID=3366038 RepID=UPI0038281490